MALSSVVWKLVLTVVADRDWHSEHAQKHCIPCFLKLENVWRGLNGEVPRVCLSGAMPLHVRGAGKPYPTTTTTVFSLKYSTGFPPAGVNGSHSSIRKEVKEHAGAGQGMGLATNPGKWNVCVDTCFAHPEWSSLASEHKKTPLGSAKGPTSPPSCISQWSTIGLREQ